MSNTFQNIFQFFFMGGYILLYVVSIIILKPFRIHRRRTKSTIGLKISYLIFLGTFLIFTYLLLFGQKVINDNTQLYDTLFNIHFLYFLSSTIVPNVGIMIRKKVKKKRIEYNVVFTIVNMLYAVYLIFLITSGKWALL